MDEDSFLSSIVKFIGFITTIGGLITQFILNEQIKTFFQINSPQGAIYLNAFSFGSLLVGLAIIIILYKYRFVLSNKRYFNRKAGHKYFKKLAQRETEQQTSRSIKKVKTTILTNDEDILIEPFYYNFQIIAIFTLVLSSILFALIFFVSKDLSKAVLYYLFVQLIVYSLTVFLLDLYNNQERKHLEKKSLNHMYEKIEEYFLPTIQYKGYIKIYQSNPSQRYIDLIVENKEYRAVINLFEPDGYFEIFPLINSRDS